MDNHQKLKTIFWGHPLAEECTVTDQAVWPMKPNCYVLLRFCVMPPPLDQLWQTFILPDSFSQSLHIHQTLHE